MKKIRLAWLSTHPIQYQAPLLKLIAENPEIDLKALFFSDFSSREFIDPEFGKKIQWDTPLLNGYKYEFLKGNGDKTTAVSFLNPRVTNLSEKLNKDNFDAVLIQGWQNLYMVKAAIIAKMKGLKVLLRCEATDYVDASTGLKRMIRELVIKILFSVTDHFMAIGSNNREFYLKRGVPAEKIGSMPYCVDNYFFQNNSANVDINETKKKYNLDTTTPVLIYSGKLIKRKYADLLVNAYANIKGEKPYLLIVGDGELMPELKKTVAEKNLDRVKLLGFRNQKELTQLYKISDIFVLPAINETWGLVVNEAMNLGCAIITTDRVGSGRDLVKNDVNGLVIPAQNEQALTEAMEKCLKNHNYEAMGKQSLEIINHWGFKENIDGLMTVLKKAFT
ncbi:MAG: glycosyltransferase family 4 protein [Pseudobdellovibrio sp.]|nr:glycosyltransferase family 4 protein [Pseudobdellovibrio sp.]